MWNLLMLDDEPPVIRALKILVRREEYGIGEIYEATNGRDGLALMAACPVHLVLLDMHMPVMDGPAFLRAALERFPDTKYIVISSYSDFKYTKQSIEARAVDYILKPIDPDELERAVKKAVELLERERRQRSRERSMRRAVAEMTPLLRRQVYTAYLKGRGSDFFTREYERLLKVEKRPRQNAVCLIKILNFADICRESFRNDHSMSQYAIGNVVEEALSSFGCICLSAMEEEEILTGILGFSEPEDSSAGMLEQRMRACLQLLEETFCARAAAAIGEITDAGHLKDSLESARTLLRGRETEGGGISLAGSFAQERGALLYDMRRYLEENYNRTLHLDDLAARYYMTKEHLTRLFKREFKSTPYEYLIRCRMERAGELLADPNRSVAEISERLGYSDVNYFSKAFRRYYGISPSQYRGEAPGKEE